MNILRNPLLKFIGILFLVTTVATMGPNNPVAGAGFTTFETEFSKSGSDPFGPFLENSSAFHFLDPLAPSSGDPSKFDPAYLDYLLVEVCRVDSSGCTLIKSFSAETSESEKLRIATDRYGSFYIVNWETSKSNFSNRATYRITVSAAGIQLGSIDLTPDIYASFGRTWPIKFLIEKDAALRVRVLAAAGMNLWQVADDLRTEFGICGEELRQLLLANYPNADADLVAEVVFGICQEVELFPTTKIADKATRDALAFYDMTTGQMVFAGDTNLLKNLRVNDVIVGRESAAAPYGYLRKVISIRKSRGMYTLETVQAKFTETIKRGTLQVSGPLEPPSGGNTADKRERLAMESRSAEFDIGKQIPFTRHIDETINLEGGDDELGGTGTIRVIGDVEIQAGYNIGAGIELCATPPFACADRVEAWMGYVHKSNLRVIGKFDGHLRKEFEYPIKMSPIFFMIGPIPVWLVPEIKVIVGFDGTAHVEFEFATAAQSTVKPYIKWTEDEGWKDLTAFAPLSNEFFDASFDGNVRLEGYAKLDAALLLYGVIGPSMDGSLGIVGTAQTGQSPFWTISGHVKAGIGLRSAFMDLFDVDAHEDFLDETFLIKAAENLKPECFVSTDSARANVTVPTFLGPTGGGFVGFFDCKDPEGGDVSYTAKANGASIDPTRAVFNASGDYTIEVTATDPDGKSNIFSFPLKVVNSPPIVTIATVSTTVGAQVQYFVTASAYDWETQAFLPCSSMQWTVTAPDQLTVSSDNRSCTAVVIFPQPGERTVSVKATDAQGGSSTRNVPVIVTSAPSNAAPVIDIESFLVTAVQGPKNSYCVTGFNCEVPYGGLLYNGQGDYHQPLTLSLSASDPNGDPLTVKWYCGQGTNESEATYNGDGTATCSPGVPGTWSSYVRAVVGDGTTNVNSEIRHFVMLQNPN